MTLKNRFETTPEGWIELRLTEITVKSISPGRICSYLTWERTSRTIGRSGYEHCCRCKHKYQDNDEVWLAFTDHGNKHICQTCATELRKNVKHNDPPGHSKA